MVLLSFVNMLLLNSVFADSASTIILMSALGSFKTPYSRDVSCHAYHFMEKLTDADGKMGT